MPMPGESDHLWVPRETTGLLSSSPRVKVASSSSASSADDEDGDDGFSTDQSRRRTWMTPTVMAVLSGAAAVVLVAVLFIGGGNDKSVRGGDDDVLPVLGAPSNNNNNKQDVPVPSTTTSYTKEALDDRITSLPGLDNIDDVGFNMFSGYLTVSREHGRSIFYWYVESQSNPLTDPVVFWTNGGPGCSGLIGFGQEHGPFHFSRDGVLTPNPYSWNTVANMLYVEIPAGVGFSYSDTPEDTVNVGDEETASDNVVAITEFLRRYPERLDNDFYVSSESYGGHYIPQLARKIVERMGTPGFNVPFRGFLVGNPWVDPFTNDVAQVRSFFQHGLISFPMMNDWLSKCSDRATYDHHKCPKGIWRMRKNMKNVSPYALDYPVCTEDKIDLNDAASSQVLQFLNVTATGDEYPRKNDLPRFLPPDVKYLPCEEQHFKVWLNQRVVQEALHVHTNNNNNHNNDGAEGGDNDVTTAATVRWHGCAPSKILSYRDDDFLDSQIDLFKELIYQATRGDLHLSMLVFSGDNDSVCSTSSTQAWIYDLGVNPIPGQDWNEWSVERQTAGFVTRFDLGEKTHSKFVFATIHGAGHEAAAYRPIEALELFKRYLNGEL